MSEATRRQLLRAAQERMREKGRRGLRRTPPRPRRPEKQIREYRASLRRLMGRIEREVRDRVFPELESILEQAGTRNDAWGDRMADLFTATRSSIDPDINELDNKIESLGDEVEEKATEEQIKAIRATLGVAPSFTNDEVSSLVNEWKRENKAFVTRMADDEIQDIQNTASRAVREGRSNREIRKDLRKRFKMSDNRAQRVARTEISQLNAQVTRERQRELGVNKFIWITANDERVRDSHEDRHGNEYSWDDLPGGEMPGGPVNCLPSGSVLNGSPFIHKMYRRRYTGVLTNLVREDGVVLSATPNHPVLTSDGFKAVQFIDKGEHVFGTLNEGFGVVDDDSEHLVPEVSELFRALVLNGVGGYVAGGMGSQFHGDGTEHEVDIIDVNGFLVGEGASDVRQKLLKLGLADADVALAGYFLSGFRPRDLGFMCVEPASAGLVRVRDLIAPLIIRHLTPLECFRLGLCSDMSASRLDMSADNASGYTEMLGDSVFAHAILVHGANAIRAQINSVWSGSLSGVPRGIYPTLPEPFSDDKGTCADAFGALGDRSALLEKPFRVVDHFTADFSGHVYNLETSAGYFVSDLHAVSNCRCSSRASVESLLNELEAE